MTPPYGRKQRRTKEPLDESKRGECKAGLKLNIQETKIMHGIYSYHFMANRWGKNGNSDRLYFLKASKSLLEKEMATRSSILAWRIPGTEEPGGLLSMGSHRVRHNWSDLAAAAAKSLQMVTAPMKLKDGCSQKKSYDKPRQCIKKQRYYFANKVPSSQSYGFPSSHVWLWELDNKECWVPKIWCFWTVMLEKTLESPLDIKEIKPLNPKRNQH